MAGQQPEPERVGELNPARGAGHRRPLAGAPAPFAWTVRADEKGKIMADSITIVYEQGRYKVRALVQEACRDCLAGWRSGSLRSPREGGDVCTHGRGQWQAGEVGPRGGWYGIGPVYRSKRAARLVCDALAEAAREPAQGIPQS